MANADQFDAATVAVLALLAVIVVPMLTMALGIGGMMGYGGTMVHDGTVGWWPLVGMLVPLVVLLVLVGGGYVLLRGTVEDDATRDAAMEELRMAYARGDLTDEEFEARRERLDEPE